MCVLYTNPSYPNKNDRPISLINVMTYVFIDLFFIIFTLLQGKDFKIIYVIIYRYWSFVYVTSFSVVICKNFSCVFYDNYLSPADAS